MKYLKLALSVIVCLAFIVAVFFLRGDFMARRVQEDMLSSNLLEFDKGSSTYIARRDDSSQILLDDGRIKGFGALTSVMGGSNTGGFTVEVPGMTEKPSGILTAALSPDGKYLATISIESELKIYRTSDSQILPFKEPIKANIVFISKNSNLLTPSESLFWTNEGLVYNTRLQDEIVWGIKDKIVAFPRLYIPETMEHKLLADSESLVEAIGKIDGNTLLFLETPRDVTLPRKFLKYSNGKTEELPIDAIFFVGYSDSHYPMLVFLDGTINLNDKTYKKEPLPEISIDGKTLDLKSLSSSITLTLRGYLFLQNAGSNKRMLIDPWSGVYVEVPDGKAPY